MSSVTDLMNVKPASVPAAFWAADVTNAAKTGVDPYLMAAIARQETGYGTLGAGRPSQGEYVLGYGYPAPGQGNPKYAGLNNQLYYGGRQLESFLNGREVTASTIRDIGFNSWKPGDPSGWANNVWNFYTQLKSEAKQPISAGDAGITSITEGTEENPKLDFFPAHEPTASPVVGGVTYYATLVIIALVGVFFVSRIFK